MEKKQLILTAVAGLICVGALSAVCGMGYAIHQKNNTIASLREALERAGEDPDIAVQPPTVYEPTTVNHFYDRRGHKILLSDNTFGQIWIPVLEDVALSTHPVEHMVETVQGRVLSFDADGNLNALTGIDISAHNTVTDWEAVKADGIDFVMLRTGYRSYGTGAGSGKLQKDTTFRANYKAAKEAGLLVGAYFFSQAVTEEEAIEEAILTAKQIEGCELDFPVAYDWEIIYNDTARTDNIPVDVLTDCVLAYCQNMESFGYQAMYYQNKRTSLFKLDLPRLKEIPFWLAEYGDGPTYIYDYDMWQYSCTGKVDGITGDVDLNLCFRDFSQDGHPLISLPAPAYTLKSEDSEPDEPEESDDSMEPEESDASEASDSDDTEESDADTESDEETEEPE